MDEKINDIAQQVVDSNQTTDQFAVSQTPYHTHNGSDSQRVKFIALTDTPASYHGQAGKVATVNSTESGLIFSSNTTNIYGGSVQSSGSPGTVFPAGWSSSRFATGQYLITHTLGTANFVIVTQLGPAAGFVGQTAISSVTSSQIAVNVVDMQNFPTPYNFANAPFWFMVLVP